MVLNIPANFYELAYHHSLSGSSREAVVTIGVHYIGTSFATDAVELVDGWGTTMVQSMADVWTYTGGTLRDAVGAVFTRSAAVGGGTAHTATTPNVAFLIRKNTGLGGRANHGRWYVPGVSEQDVDAVGTVVGSKITEINGHLSDWITNATGHNFFPYILHNGTPAPTAISSFTVETIAATQRRRMRK